MTGTNGASVCVMTALGGLVGGQPATTQDVSRYRGYVLESSLDSVLEDSGVRAKDVQTVHERPAQIHALEWSAPFLSSDGEELADPVHDITFAFYNRALYQIMVSYARDRTDALTGNDIIEALTVTYGSPVVTSAISRPPTMLRDSIVLAQWENDSSSVTLLRDTYSSEFKLILLSKALSARARDAIREATRLDAIEAPRRQLEQQEKEVTDASVAREKTRTINKAAFRP
jgi:hypothetical protein